MRQCNQERLLELGENKHLTSISALRLAKCTMDDDAFATLVSSPHLANLELLSISHTQVTAEMSVAVANSSFAAGLRVLDLGYPLTDSSVDLEKLVKGLPKLQFFDVAACELRPENAQTIASTGMKALRFLALKKPDIEESGLEAMLASTKLKKLRWLDLWDVEDVEPLVGPMKLKLDRLSLTRNQIRDGDVAALFHSEHLASLKCLNLTYCPYLTAKCVPEILQSPVFANLDCFRFSCSKKKLNKTAFESLVRAWKDLERPVGNLCLRQADLPSGVLKDIRKRYGKDSFVEHNTGIHGETATDMSCHILRPHEELFDVFDSWRVAESMPARKRKR